MIPAVAGPAARRWTGSDLGAAGVLVLIGAAVPLLVAHHFGALGIPRNDDWAFLLAAFGFAHDGSVDPRGWAGMNLVGQLVLAVPVVWIFGREIGPLQVGVAALGAVGLVAVYDLGRGLIGRRAGLLVAATVAIGPLWAPLEISFMTDVPAMALAMISLALGARAIGPHAIRSGLLVTALVVGFVGFTVRELAVAAPAAVCLTALWSATRVPTRTRHTVWASAAVLVLAVVVTVAWNRQHPGYVHADLGLPEVARVRSALRRTLQAAVLVGFLVMPAVVLAGPARCVRAARARAPRVAPVLGVGGLALLLVVVVANWGDPLGPGNYVVADGVLGTSTIGGARPALLGAPVLAACAGLGALAAVTTGLAAIPPLFDLGVRMRDRRWDPPAAPGVTVVALAAAGYAASFAALGLLGAATFDRYLLPLVPLTGILVVRVGRRRADTGRPARRRVAVAASFGLLAVVGAVYAANSASFDGARWEVASATAEVVGDPERVDGGFEWNDFHAEREVYLSASASASASPSAPTRGAWCAVVRAERAEPEARDTSVLAASAVWGPSDAQTWIVARARPC